MDNFKIKFYFNIIFLISLISLISAYFIEYILGYQPCNLCLIERIPYGLSIILIIVNHLFNIDKKFLILILVLIFIFSLLISIYHLGIEQGVFEESAVCGLKGASEIFTKDELLKQLKQRTISCKDVTFRIFGFSLTTINIILNLIIIITFSWIFKNYAKFKS
mgnify:CR=1 FL=1|tara:strand:- start:9053 stop:9541 length:489 start_codon:yes stop_codon:yes gene_type:complete